MNKFFLALLSLLFITGSVTAWQANWSVVEGNLSQGALNLAGNGMTDQGGQACQSNFFTGTDCGLIIYGLINLVLLNLLLFGLRSDSSIFVMTNLLLIYVLDYYQLLPHGIFIAVVGMLGSVVLAWGLWRLFQGR